MIRKYVVLLLLAIQVALLSSSVSAAQKIAPDLFTRFETHMDRLADRLAKCADPTLSEDPARVAEMELKDLSALNEEILEAFNLIERELKGISAKKTVQTALRGRHQDFVNHYRESYSELASKLEVLKNLSNSTTSKDVLTEAVSSLITLVRGVQISRHQPLDPYNLPVGIATFDDTHFDFPPQQNSDLDLAETPGVMFTEAVEKLAESLKENPVRMAQWVKDNIDFIPMYGSMKGSELCLLDRNGNDYDQASLLIALLRSSDFPARYVYGRIQVEENDLASWLGVEEIELARETIRNHGIPVKDRSFDHIWVEAYLEDPSRWGIDGPPRWISVDPSFKRYSLTNISRSGRENGLSGFVFPPDIFQKSIPGEQRDYTIARNIIHQPIDTVLPYRVEKRLWAGPTLGRDFAFRVQVTLSRSGEETLFSKEFLVEELARQSVSLLYLPAEFQDSTIMKGLQSLFENPDSAISFLPAYLIKVRPHLLVGNRIVLSGKPGWLGEKQNLSATLFAPRFKKKTFRHTVLAGSQTAMRVLAGGMSRFSTLPDSTYGYTFKEKLLKEPLEYLEEKLGTAFLNRIGLDYLSKLSKLRDRVANRKGIIVNSFFSEGVVSRGVNTGYLLGRPASFEYSGVQMDIQADLFCAAYNSNGDLEKIRLLTTIGSYGSMLEYQVLEAASNEPVTAVSAIRVISKAKEMGIPVKKLKPGDEKLLSFLPQPLQSDIRGVLSRKQEVYIPQSPVKIGDWEGYAYILNDPATGACGYMINGRGAARRGAARRGATSRRGSGGTSTNVGAYSNIGMPKGTIAKFLMVILVLGAIIILALILAAP